MVFAQKDYRTAVEYLIQRRRQLEPKLTYAKLAEAARIQPTYFSNVLKGRAEFNADQLFSICESLGADTDEQEFVVLLLERERCRHPRRTARLDKKLSEIRQNKLGLAENLSARAIDPSDLQQAEYYLDPLLQLVHVFLTLPRYAKEVRKIGPELNLSSERLEGILRRLEALGYAAVNPDGSYRRLNPGRHLLPTSPVCLPHQTLMRLLSAEQLNRLPLERRKHASVTFSCTPEVFEQMHVEFLKFLKKAETLVRDSKETQVFQLNFDLFPWGQ